MKPLVSILILLVLTIDPGISQTHEFVFVRTYIHNLGGQYAIEVAAQSELKEAGSDLTKMSIVNMRNAKRFNLELQTGINSLLEYRRSHNPLVSEVAEVTVQCYSDLIRNFRNVVAQSQNLLNATTESDANIDAGAMINNATDISTQHEYLMGTLSKSAQLLAFSLLDTIPDPNGKLTYLLITSTERKQLLHQLDLVFGDSIKDVPEGRNLSANQTIGYLLRVLLTTDKKSKDERLH